MAAGNIWIYGWIVLGWFGMYRRGHTFSYGDFRNFAGKYIRTADPQLLTRTGPTLNAQFPRGSFLVYRSVGDSSFTRETEVW